jgi:hypothetical protein
MDFDDLNSYTSDDSTSYTPTMDDYGLPLDQSYENALAQQREYEQRAADQAAADYISSEDQYRDYGSLAGMGAPGTSYDITPGGISGGKKLLNRLTRDSKGNLDWAKIAMLMYGAKTLADGKRPAPKLGFQGTIPKYQATSNLKTAPPPGRKAGAYGINYGGDPLYTKMAEGGLANLAKGRYLQGETDGMADKIPARIGRDQPAALSHGEFVIPADVVSHLGNGNSDAGAKKLYSMMDNIRKARTGNKKQGKRINPDKFMPGGLAQAYANGGSVMKFQTGGTTTPTSGEQTLSTWAAPYVTDMLAKGQALSEKPYEAYTGQLTAGPSNLQTKVFEGLGSVNFPGNLGKSFSSTDAYTPPSMNTDAYKPAPIGTGTPRPTYEQYTASLPAGQQPIAKNIYDAGLAGSDVYKQPAGIAGSQPTTMVEAQANQPQNTGIASQYMNPYLQSVLTPQLAELRRQAEITNQTGLGALTKSGAFGGGRQAIMESEAARNLMQTMNKTVGEGYATAYDKGMGQFNLEQDKARDLAKMMADQGVVERGLESEQVAADKAQFEEARANPYKMVQFQQSLLDKLPIQTTNYGGVTPSMLETLSGNMKTMNDLLDRLGLLEKPPK